MQDKAIDAMGDAAMKYGPIGVKDLVTLAERACAAAAQPQRGSTGGADIGELYGGWDLDVRFFAQISHVSWEIDSDPVACVLWQDDEDDWAAEAAANGGGLAASQAAAFKQFVDDRQRGIMLSEQACTL